MQCAKMTVGAPCPVPSKSWAPHLTPHSWAARLGYPSPGTDKQDHLRVCSGGRCGGDSARLLSLKPSGCPPRPTVPQAPVLGGCQWEERTRGPGLSAPLMPTASSLYPVYMNPKRSREEAGRSAISRGLRPGRHVP